MTGAALMQSSFYWPIRLVPADRRAALSAVYAWCAHLDAIVDTAGDCNTRAARLVAWREWLRDPAAPAPEPVIGAAFARAMADFGLDRADAEALIVALTSDLARELTDDRAGAVRAPDTAALLDYCVGVAGAPGRMCLAVLGWRGDAARRYADAAGIAVQLTNILRDVEDDARAGRLYLPREALAAAGIAATTPMAAIGDARFAEAWTATARLAEARFDAAAALAPIDRGARPAVAMVAIYRDLLNRLRRRGWQPGAPRLARSRWRGLAIALRVMMWGR